MQSLGSRKSIDDLERGRVARLASGEDDLSEKCRSNEKRLEAEMDRVVNTQGGVNDEDGDDSDDVAGLPPTPFRQLLESINPIDVDEFSEMSWYNKVYEIAKVCMCTTRCTR